MGEVHCGRYTIINACLGGLHNDYHEQVEHRSADPLAASPLITGFWLIGDVRLGSLIVGESRSTDVAIVISLHSFICAKRRAMHVNSPQRESAIANAAHPISCQKLSPIQILERSVASPCRMNFAEPVSPGLPSSGFCILSPRRFFVVPLLVLASSLPRADGSEICLTEGLSGP